MPGDDDAKGSKPVDGPQHQVVTQALSDASNLPNKARGPDGIQGAHGFASGSVLAERYRIVRFIARGGMGEVYEAEDLVLGGGVALKTIRPEIAEDRTAVERFKREIAIARKITHPNVSRVFDIGVHRDASTTTMFLTMQFLAGETLLEALTSHGRMSEREALPIAEQIAAGLAAAHDAGVIHRDFKSANVMLVPGGAGREVTAVVTDFGLARPVARGDGSASISEAGLVLGTPTYMAPEQVEGLRLTPAADIYAFGIVLYEMVTGRRPFEAQTPMSSAVKRLTERPVSPRQFIASLDPAWEAAILHCLERDPGSRFASALDVIRAIKSGEIIAAGSGQETRRIPNSQAETLLQPQIITTPPGEASRGRLRLIGIAIAGALLIAAAGAWFWPSWRRSTVAPAARTSQPAAIQIRRGIAVEELANNSGQRDAAWLSTAIADMLSTELAAGGKLRVTSGEEVARLKADMSLGASGALKATALPRNRLGVDWLVVGSYTLVGDSGSRLLRIDTRVLDANDGKVIATSGTSGTEMQLFDLVARIAAGLRQKLGVRELTAAEAVEVQASVPSSREAARLYSDGVAKLRQLDAAGARDDLLKAVAADAKHPLIRSALSTAYSALGYDAKAREEAAKALALSGSLSPEQRSRIEGRLHETAREWDKAVSVEKSLWESFPDNLEYGLRLADAQISAGRTKEALVTIDALRKLPSSISRDGRIDLTEARAYQELGNFARQRTLAAAAGAKGSATGSRLLVARARMLEATALLALGETRATMTAADEARTLFLAAGDQNGVARALELTAAAVDRQGDFEGERKLLEQALDIHRRIGDQSSVARVLLNIGTVLVSEGKSSDAERFFDEALSTFRQLGATFPAAVALNEIGMMMFNRGDLTMAEKRYEEGLTLFSQLGEKTGTATTLTNIAEVLECRGNLEQARAMHEDALAINRAIGDKSGTAWDLFRLGEIFSLRGDFVAARARYDEALAIQTQIGDKLAAAETRLSIAEIAIAQGKPAEAEKPAREAEEIMRVEGAAQKSARALAVVADSLLAQGKQAEANGLAARAWQSATKSEDRRIRFAVAITLARATAASRKPQDVNAALKLLEQTTLEASKSLFVGAAMQARLAAGEIELAAGRPQGKKHLAALEKEATSKGFGAIARRAAAGAA